MATSSEPDSSIALRHVSHAFGASSVLKDVCLDVAPGEFVAIVGPSGCGKTTILNLAAGLETRQSGEVVVGGRSDGERDRISVGYGFARDALLPWRTALENVALPLLLQGRPKREAFTKARQELVKLGLSDSVHAYRSQLSQGMRQRVALARTLVRRPQILLMDEPFAALDAQTRIDMQGELSLLTTKLGTSVLFVTHDIGEAVALADRVVLMSPRPGRISKVFDIDLRRPRDVVSLQQDSRYLELYALVWHELREVIEQAKTR